MAIKKDPIVMAKTLVELLGENNIKSFTNCMTRLRVTVSTIEKADIEKIKKTPNVMGVVISGTEIQVILGPGFVNKTVQEIKKLYPNLSYGTEVAENIDDDLKKTQTLADVAATEKAKAKEKQTSSIQKFMSKISKIFAPLIFGFIGAGLLAGIAGMIEAAATELVGDGSFDRIWTSDLAKSWFEVLSVSLNIWKSAFIIIVGWRTSEVFGGSGVVGGLAAGFFVSQFSGFYTAAFIEQTNAAGEKFLNFLGIKIYDPTTHWLTIGFRPGGDAVEGWSLSYTSGGIFGAMMIAGFGVPIEKQIRKVMPNSIDIVGSSLLTYAALVVLAYMLIIPISGLMFNIVDVMFQALYANPFGAAVLAAIFLLAVTFGVHQGFVPIYAALLESTGINGLFPVLAMSGAGQVGVALAVLKNAAKDSQLKQQVKGAIIPGVLGIGEPLIYAMSLPRPKLFISGMIGGAVGGFYLGALNTWAGLDIGLNTMFGPSGLLAAPLMTTPSGNMAMAIPAYLGGLGISYFAGFGASTLIGFKGVDLS